MAGRLTLQEPAQLAARYKVWRSVVQVQRWWRPLKKDMLKLTLRQSRTVMENSSPHDLTSPHHKSKKRSTFQFQRPGCSASCSRNVYPWPEKVDELKNLNNFVTCS